MKFGFRVQFIVGIYTLLAVLGCGDVRLRSSESSVSLASTGEFCTEPPAALGQYTKIMFVVDMSGSNQVGNGSGVGTDPNKDRRGNSIQNFLNSHRDNKFIDWGFVVFNGVGAESYIPEQGGANLIFTHDPAQMDDAMARFRATPDTDGTPYKAALGLVRSALLADQKKNSGSVANYMIVLMSDGYPTDYGDVINTAAIYTDVDNLVATSQGHVFLSTIYYGPVDPVAENILFNMAQRGLGQYQNTNTDSNINIDNLIVGGVSNEPYTIKQLAVYNLSGAICEDGSVGTDSDADGLCDKDEENYNRRYANNQRMMGKKFDPQNRNSVDPRFSDAYFLKYIQGESLPSCGGADLSDEDHDLSNLCEEKYFFNSNPQGPTVDWTNDMIKRSHDGDSKNFDSDGDGILDGLEFLFFKNKSVALNYNNISEKINSYDYKSLFLNHLNPLNPLSSEAYEPNFNFLQKNDAGQNCYHYSQKSLTLYPTKAVNLNQVGGSLDLTHEDSENIVLVYYIQTPEYAPNSKGYLRYSYQKLKAGRDGPGSIRLTPAIFDIYPKP